MKKLRGLPYPLWVFLLGCTVALFPHPSPRAAGADPPPREASPPPDAPDATREGRTPVESGCPPRYENLRYREDWKPCLDVPLDERGDWTDRLKARRFGSRWFRFDTGGQIRFRAEVWRNQGFGGPPHNDDGWMLGRFRLHTDLRFGENVRVFLEGIYADQWKRQLGSRPIDVNQGDLLNAFVEVGGKLQSGLGFGAAVGRRELQLGKQRLISPLDWANTRRTFQGAYAWVEKGPHRVDGFAVRPVAVDKYDFDEWDDDVAFWGLHSHSRVITSMTGELYLLGLHRDPGRYLSGTRSEDRYTTGARLGGDVPRIRFDYDVEGGYQYGHFGSENISAGFLSIDCGWKPWVRYGEPRVGAGFDWATGNKSSGRTQGTFNQLFPLGHAYLGFADLLGRQNLVAARGTLTAKPVDTVTLRADYHAFWRSNRGDAAYNVAGGILRAPMGVDNLFIGTELDLTFAWTIGRHWIVAGGWSHFFTGDFIERTGPSKDIDFLYLGLQCTF